MCPSMRVVKDGLAIPLKRGVENKWVSLDGRSGTNRGAIPRERSKRDLVLQSYFFGGRRHLLAVEDFDAEAQRLMSCRVTLRNA
jgi:hypothetical protein